MKSDRRLTPARDDLAAAHLKGQVDAPRYAEGQKFSIGMGRAALRMRPSDDAAQDSELLFGESFTVYDRANGWVWGQAANDLYVGYLRENALMAPFAAEASVTALMAPVFAAADLKTPVRELLPLNAAVPFKGRQGDYVKIAEGCDYTCAFCIIPTLRGSYRSRTIESIVREARSLAEQLWKVAGIGPSDIDVAMIYENFSPVVLLQLEAFGFCGRGEAKDFIADGHIELGGSLPVNTHGGLLGEAYIHGVNNILEGVRQIRGTAANQVADVDHVLVAAGRSAAVLGRVQ